MTVKHQLPSYYDLMMAFMALRDGKQDHDLQADTGMRDDDPDLKRIIDCRSDLQAIWSHVIMLDEKYRHDAFNMMAGNWK